jgi:hypothetical protein
MAYAPETLTAPASGVVEINGVHGRWMRRTVLEPLACDEAASAAVAHILGATYLPYPEWYDDADGSRWDCPRCGRSHPR